jgi:hypothetical protein
MTATPLANLVGEFWRMSVQLDLASGGCPSDRCPILRALCEGWAKGGTKGNSGNNR